MIMKYFSTLKECKQANPDALWFYHDRKGPAGQMRWYASKRILKKAVEQLELSGYSIYSARKQGLDVFAL
jgi:hypothetical protein